MDQVDEVEGNNEDIQVSPEEILKRKSEELRTLKNQQTASISAVTKKRKELSNLMADVENLHTVKTGLEDFRKLCALYNGCHEAYYGALLNVEDKEDESKGHAESNRHDEKELSIIGFQTQIQGWIHQTENLLSDQIDGRSRRSSLRSNRSSLRSVRTVSSVKSSRQAHLAEEVKLAELMVQKSAAGKQTELAKRQADLKAQEELVKLEVEIEKSKARKKIFADNVLLEEDVSLHSIHIKKTLDPAATIFEPQPFIQQKPLDSHAKSGFTTDSQQQQETLTNISNQQSHDLLPSPQQQNVQFDMMLQAHQRLTTAMILPNAEVTKFSGDIMEFTTFIMAFDARIVSHTTSDSDRLYYLNQHLVGESQNLIGGCLYMNPAEGYKHARDLLQKEYGDPYKVSMAYVDKVLSWPIVKGDDCKGLKQLALFLIRCNEAMKSMSHMNVLNHAPNLQAILQKVPIYLQNKWRGQATKIRNSKENVVFSDLVQFLESAAESANDPVFGRIAMANCDGYSRRDKPITGNSGKQRSSSFVTSVGTEIQPKELTYQRNQKYIWCHWCKKAHDMDECEQFLRKSLQERIDFVKEKRLCFGCFGQNHTSKGCMRKRQCKVCGKRHPTALHDDKFFMARSAQLQTPVATTGSAMDQVSTSTCRTTDTVLQAILPVKIHVKDSDKSVETYAFYDNGSTGCFITESIKDKLNPACNDTVLKLQTMHGVDYVRTSVVYDIVVTDLKGENAVNLPKTYVKQEIPVCHNQIPKPELLQKWSHLECIVKELPAYNPSLEIGVLIGSNCPAALQPIKVVPTSGNGPFAVKYKHGWTVNGPVHIRVDSKGVICNRVMFTEIEHVKESVMPDQINKMFSLDFSERDIGQVPNECGMSIEDQKFLKKTEKNIVFEEGHYKIPLPFRDDNVADILPNNRAQAFSRAEWQKKKMLKQEKYYKDYVAFVEKLMAKGYAHKVPKGEEDVSAMKWYLPHHGVYHPKKPEKIRVVFDCSAKYRDVSLNSTLLQGPDLTNSIIGVLTRFRQEKIAFIGDIEAMFYQVHVPSSQQDCLRFLWWPDGDLQSPLEEYRMSVHIFGAASSPSVCNFALKKTADYAEEKYGYETANTIRRNFYVDDCLKSCADTQSAVALIQTVTNALKDRGFHLAKFASNSTEVIKSVPLEERSKDIQACDLDYGEMQAERTLGIQWHMQPDVFKFSITANLVEKPLTRRGLLSTVSSLYDPLGLVSPFILPAKKILQDLCKERSLGWDDQIPDEYKPRWVKWLTDLSKLEELSIDRCMKPEGFGEIKTCQLHMFADASSYGYGVAAYIRLDDGNMIKTTLLMGKARLAPLKCTTIPKLELTAATVAVTVAQHILKELDMKVDSVTYYTDSTTVLHYINNEKKRFPIFVANRVRMIRDYSLPSQWKYVHTSENPADIPSRGADAQQLLNSHLWFNGPKFLSSSEITEAIIPPYESCDEDEIEAVAAITVDSSVGSVYKLLEHYSSMYRLKRAVAIYRRLFDILKFKGRISKTESLRHQELQDAETAIVKFIQKQEFPEEVKLLEEQVGKRGRVVKKSSSIYKLDPFMDPDSHLLRVGGRLEKADDMSYEMKHQILLPHRSHITTLLIRSVHEKISHAGRNHVLAAVRERFWIISANSAVRSVISHCVICHKLRSPVMEQVMADLPKDRVTPAPPFSSVGVDLFGPHLIKEGRKELKKYGVLFTCLTSRAVHIETANSLETDAFINALRRFIARRAQPNLIRCDNGTNFRGAEKELFNALQEMDQKRIENYLLQMNIQWKFNPPAASHMGGVWERQIRTVRKVLAPMLKEFGNRLDDESYRTLLCEVECIINSRPLTTVSDSVDDLNPLTPSHLLTTKSTIITPPPGNFQKNDVYLRRRWRQVQYLANVFWSRWKKEYLQTLQVRQKWNTPRRNLQNGDIILIKEDTLPRNMWAMGRVVEVDEDSQGMVRSAKVKTKDGELRRPIQKLVLLLNNEM